MNLLSKWNEWDDTIKRLKNVSDQKVSGVRPNDVTSHLTDVNCLPDGNRRQYEVST